MYIPGDIRNIATRELILNVLSDGPLSQEDLIDAVYDLAAERNQPPIPPTPIAQVLPRMMGSVLFKSNDDLLSFTPDLPIYDELIELADDLIDHGDLSISVTGTLLSWVRAEREADPKPRPAIALPAGNLPDDYMV